MIEIVRRATAYSENPVVPKKCAASLYARSWHARTVNSVAKVLPYSRTCEPKFSAIQEKGVLTVALIGDRLPSHASNRNVMWGSRLLRPGEKICLCCRDFPTPLPRPPHQCLPPST